MKVRDLAGLYLNPPDAAVVLCVDHKSQIQALDRTAPILPLMPGTPQRLTHDYRRYGTTNLHAALDTASGRVITSMTRRNRTHKFQAFLNLINREVPSELDVHVVLDNASPHKTEPIQRWLQRHPRFTFHHTPTYASWMNLVERWFSELTTKQIRRGTHRSVAGTHRRHQPMDPTLEPKPQTLHLAQNRRPNLRQPHQLSTTNPRLRTLGEC